MTNRPPCPYPCAGSYCPFTRSDADCIACEARPALDAWHLAIAAWDEAYNSGPPPEEDRTGSSHPYSSPALAGWGGGDR
jgi:hypothetical protein